MDNVGYLFPLFVKNFFFARIAALFQVCINNIRTYFQISPAL